MFGGGGSSGNRGYTLLAAVVREENRVGTRGKVREGKGKGLSRTGILYKNTDGRFVASNTPTVDSLYHCLPSSPSFASLSRLLRLSQPLPTLCHRLRASPLPFPPSLSLSLSVSRVRSGLRATHARRTTRLRLKRIYRFAVSSLLLKSCTVLSR